MFTFEIPFNLIDESATQHGMELAGAVMSESLSVIVNVLVEDERKRIRIRIMMMVQKELLKYRHKTGMYYLLRASTDDLTGDRHSTVT